jgi:hypothetical protein
VGTWKQASSETAGKGYSRLRQPSMGLSGLKIDLAALERTRLYVEGRLSLKGVCGESWGSIGCEDLGAPISKHLGIKVWFTFRYSRVESR